MTLVWFRTLRKFVLNFLDEISYFYLAWSLCGLEHPQIFERICLTSSFWGVGPFFCTAFFCKQLRVSRWGEMWAWLLPCRNNTPCTLAVLSFLPPFVQWHDVKPRSLHHCPRGTHCDFWADSNSNVEVPEGAVPFGVGLHIMWKKTYRRQEKFGSHFNLADCTKTVKIKTIIFFTSKAHLILLGADRLNSVLELWQHRWFVPLFWERKNKQPIFF